jgi:hypothetical protein
MRKTAFLVLLSFIILASKAEDRTTIDHPIVGKWEYVKTILPDGSEVVDLIATEHYYSDGTLLFVNLWLSPQPVEEFSNTPEEIEKNLINAYGGMCTYTIEKEEEKDRLTYEFVNSTRTEDMGTSHSVDIKVNGDTLIFYLNSGAQLIMKRSVPEPSQTTGIRIESTKDQNISVLPNPANTFLSINTMTHGTYHIEISSMKGQIILTRKIEGPSHQIDLSSFQKGTYIITVRSKDLIAKRKMIKI